MTPHPDIIYQLLLDLNLGTASGAWPVYVGFIPSDAPDNSITVYDSAGRLDGRIMATGEQIEHPGIQVIVRGRSYVDTNRKAHEIALQFDAQRMVQVDGDSSETYTIQNISRTGSVVPMGVESISGRSLHNFSINAVLTLRLND